MNVFFNQVGPMYRLIKAMLVWESVVSTRVVLNMSWEVPCNLQAQRIARTSMNRFEGFAQHVHCHTQVLH